MPSLLQVSIIIHFLSIIHSFRSYIIIEFTADVCVPRIIVYSGRIFDALFILRNAYAVYLTVLELTRLSFIVIALVLPSAHE